MKNKGFMLSIDLLLASIIALACILLIMNFSLQEARESSDEFNGLELEKQAVYFADFLVKSGDGLAFFDESKKRIEERKI
ncbi:hypothetical protein HZB89_01290 [archaeon]|nr:hypothetical protein [archaeon]